MVVLGIVAVVDGTGGRAERIVFIFHGRTLLISYNAMLIIAAERSIVCWEKPVDWDEKQ